MPASASISRQDIKSNIAEYHRMGKSTEAGVKISKNF